MDTAGQSGKGMACFSEETARWFARSIGTPTRVQELAWPVVAAGENVLVSAPTGTGKTLCAFLVCIDRLIAKAREGTLREETSLIYISPLKSLAADIRENLRRPLEGIARECGVEGQIRVGIRTGDTPQAERARMARRPPHILITTPESLFLMLTSASGGKILGTVRTVIIDELHAVIDSKRGAHLMLSIARVEKRCGRALQRIGLSATIDPLELAARYLAPSGAKIVAPPMDKQTSMSIHGFASLNAREYSPVWEEMAQAVYERCQTARTVIAFTEARRYAEKLSYHVNLIAGEGFSRVHHGSLAREQRQEAEEALRAGKLRLLCATSSMELGIDVGDVDVVLQIGCPRTVSGTMQRLGRAGHNPGRVSVMHLYARTALEGIRCGMTAVAARAGGVEKARVPRLCLDVLSQHLVSMAAYAAYTVEDVMDILAGAYPFRDVTREDVKACLDMLCGAYEHRREVPVRPRVIYDRLHERVIGDTYSRMLAVSAGGTIPDKGLYAARTEEGVKIGELDEEFVYETRIGDTFLLGAFGWRVLRIEKDSVILRPTGASGGRVPFWHGEIKGRPFHTSVAFGRMMRKAGEAYEADRAKEELHGWGLDGVACENGEDLIARQIAVTGALPDERTIIIERFTGETGNAQMMVHSVFGRSVNAPLALLIQHAVKKECGADMGCVDEEDGILLYGYDEKSPPEGILYTIAPESVRPMLEAMLPSTPLFGMAFRYNAARALMTGMRAKGRQPLWMQRLRSAEMLDTLKEQPNHPLIRETRRECMEDQWDVSGVESVLRDIRAGQIAVREMTVETPSPFSLPLQWQAEANEMYAYSPVTEGVRQAVSEQVKAAEGIRPSQEALAQARRQGRKPESALELYGAMTAEGDFTAAELADGDVGAPLEWLETLGAQGMVAYVEPGLWIAAEYAQDYAALAQREEQAACGVLRRMLYYRGAHTPEQAAERYALDAAFAGHVLEMLCAQGEAVCDAGAYYHARLYERARKDTLYRRRQEMPACPPERYAALQAARVEYSAPAQEQLARAMEELHGRAFPAALWEGVLLPRRVRGYRPEMLDRLLAQGEYVWRMEGDGRLCFLKEAQIDWDAPPTGEQAALEGIQALLWREINRRGATFLRQLARVAEESGFTAAQAQEGLYALARKGILCADSFEPVRRLLQADRIEKAPLKQRARLRAQAMTEGRWDKVRAVRRQGGEEALRTLLKRENIVCRETFLRAMDERCDVEKTTWTQALEVLRIWEYTGRVRRGYFVAGLSGAQFIAPEKYEATGCALRMDAQETVWLHAQDTALSWGRELASAHDGDGQPLRRMPGCAVALQGGRAVLAFEQSGRTLRVMDEAFCADAGRVAGALRAFAALYRQKQLFPSVSRLSVKRYPKALAPALEEAGFVREMLDYVLR